MTRRESRVARGLAPVSPARAEWYRERSLRKLLPAAAEGKALITEYKLARGCTDCGYRAHAAALDLDHLPGFEKRANVGRLFSREAILAELAKCEVVCANCHRIRTGQRAGYL